MRQILFIYFYIIIMVVNRFEHLIVIDHPIVIVHRK